jgi:hypothetical protein
MLMVGTIPSAAPFKIVGYLKGRARVLDGRGIDVRLGFWKV